MKTKKELAKYLADYIDYELDAKKEEYDFDTAIEFVLDNLSGTIEEGLDAFESTENVKVEITDSPLDTITDNAGCGCGPHDSCDKHAEQQADKERKHHNQEDEDND